MKISTTSSLLVYRAVLSLVLACVLAGTMALSTACKKEQEPEAPGPQQQAAPGEDGYRFKITAKNMTLCWRPDGDRLNLLVRAATDGWVSVGFNATEGMKDAWLIMGYMKDGAVTISEQHGNTPKTHLKKSDLGGTASVTGASGKVKNNETELRFSIPLKPADIEKPINPGGDTMVLLAYGKTKQLAQLHAFRAKLKVNLATGAYSILTMK
jgi:hypothetical protein